MCISPVKNVCIVVSIPGCCLCIAAVYGGVIIKVNSTTTTS